MKIDYFRLVLVTAISALIAWGCYEIADEEPYATISAIAVGAYTFVTCGASVAMNYKEGRTGVSIKLLSGLFCTGGIIMNIVFAFFEYNIPLFAICNGLLLVVFLLIAQSLYKTRQ